MKTHKEKDREENQLDESTISQFRKYLSEICKIQPLAAPLLLSWWDK